MPSREFAHRDEVFRPGSPPRRRSFSSLPAPVPPAHDSTPQADGLRSRRGPEWRLARLLDSAFGEGLTAGVDLDFARSTTPNRHLSVAQYRCERKDRKTRAQRIASAEARGFGRVVVNVMRGKLIRI